MRDLCFSVIKTEDNTGCCWLWWFLNLFAGYVISVISVTMQHLCIANFLNSCTFTGFIDLRGPLFWNQAYDSFCCGILWVFKIMSLIAFNNSYSTGSLEKWLIIKLLELVPYLGKGWTQQKVCSQCEVYVTLFTLNYNACLSLNWEKMEEC